MMTCTIGSLRMYLTLLNSFYLPPLLSPIPRFPSHLQKIHLGFLYLFLLDSPVHGEPMVFSYRTDGLPRQSWSVLCSSSATSTLLPALPFGCFMQSGQESDCRRPTGGTAGTRWPRGPTYRLKPASLGLYNLLVYLT